MAGATDELEPPSGAEVVKVGSTREMRQAMVDRAPDADVVIMAAAVADFRPEAEANTKLKKGQADDALSTIRLTENPDILKDLMDMREAGQVASTIIGFAAETDNELENGRAKLKRKGADMLMLNSVAGGGVFGQARNRGWLLSADGGEEEIPDGTKHEVAVHIWNAIERLAL